MREGQGCLCTGKYVFGDEIVGKSIDSRVESSLAMNTLNNAVAMRGDVTGCIHRLNLVNSGAGSYSALATHCIIG